MLISKFDLYRNEWLDLVFSDRNKAYGAYELRQHNSQVMLKALGIMCFSILVVAFVFGVILKPAIKPKPDLFKITDVALSKIVYPPVLNKPKPVIPHTLKPSTPAPAAPTTRLVPLVAAPDPVASNPPKLADLDGKTIGSIDAKGPASSGSTVDQGAGTGSGTSTGTGDEVVPYGLGLQREPLPFGGMAAFEKFLQKHLRYPDEASEAHIQGKVFMSFIVEKDGSLSNITIVRGPGYGTNEEAMRVLKLAPAWQPGIQNNHPVRVQYTIPINFQLGDDDN